MLVVFVKMMKLFNELGGVDFPYEWNLNTQKSKLRLIQ